jgi:hypothetical protein
MQKKNPGERGVRTMLSTVKGEKLTLRLAESVRDALGTNPRPSSKTFCLFPASVGSGHTNFKEPLVAISGASGLSIDGSSVHSGCAVQTHFD